MSWTTRIISTAPQVDVRFNMTQGTQNVNNNTTVMNWSVQSITHNGSRTGTWDYRAVVDGSTRANSSNSSTHSGTQTLASGSYTVSHDANGRKTVSGSGWLDAYFGSGTASGSRTLTRIARAPYGLSQSTSLITATTIRITLNISNRGHGTSATHRAQYKRTNVSSWTDTSNQSVTDLQANNFDITGLTSNAAYHYRQRAWNNNDDVAHSSQGSFTTLPVAPSAGTAVIDATSATIPTTQNNGGGANSITNQVRYREVDGSWSGWSTYTDNQAVLTGLTPGIEYQYQLRSTTSAGTTEGSVKSLTTLPAAKLIMPDGTVRNAIPHIISPEGVDETVKVKVM